MFFGRAILRKQKGCKVRMVDMGLSLGTRGKGIGKFSTLYCNAPWCQVQTADWMPSFMLWDTYGVGMGNKKSCTL